MRRYELIAIIDPAVSEDGSTETQRLVEALFEKQGGHIERTTPPKRVSLATPMDGNTEAFRFDSVVVLPEDRVAAVQQALRHREELLRVMIVRAEVTASTATPMGATRSSASRTEESSQTASRFSDADFAKEINAVIERETEGIGDDDDSNDEDEAAEHEATDKSPAADEEEIQEIDEELDKILGDDV